MNKKPILINDTFGLVADRLQSVYHAEALKLLNEHVVSREELDRIVTLGAGFLEGPLTAIDYAGLDTVLSLSEALYAESGQDPRYRPSPLLRRMVASGILGVKSEKGFFQHIRRFKV